MEKLYHGACYYPELWDEKEIDTDIAKMKECGINLIRIGEFAWSVYEPRENEFHFDFFKSVIQRFNENGIDTILCTPTPTPPVWLTHNHSERCHRDIEGVMSHGSRLHICTNNHYFRERARIIISKIARELGSLDGVVLWQLDNELKSHVSYCLCDTCKELWHKWLKEQYGTIENLNEKWGTKIFSEYYRSFEEVPQPVKTPFIHNASLLTAYRRFSMNKIEEFAWECRDEIRKYSKLPITTNGNINFDCNLSQLFKGLDTAAFDTYASLENHAVYIMNHDFWRNIKKGKKHWLVETSCCYGGSIERLSEPHPRDYLTAEAVTAYALEAKSFCYWLFRQQRTGCEISHGALYSQWGEPTIGVENVKKVTAAKQRIENIILETKLKPAEMAITYSDIARSFFESEKPEVGGYTGLIRSFHKLVYRMGIPRDVITEISDISEYKLVWTPFLPALSAEYIKKLRDFAEKGGTAILGPMTGHRTYEHTAHTDYGLGILEKEFGFKTKYIYPFKGTNPTGEAFGKEEKLTGLGFVFDEANCIIKGRLTDGLTPGEAFLIEVPVGKGRLVLLGACPKEYEDSEILKKIIEFYGNEISKPPFEYKNSTEIINRHNDNGDVFFIVNMDGLGDTVYCKSLVKDAFTGEETDRIELKPFEYRVVNL